MIKIENMYEKFNFIIEDNTTFSIPFEAIKYSGTLMKYYQNNKNNNIKLNDNIWNNKVMRVITEYLNNKVNVNDIMIDYYENERNEMDIEIIMNVIIAAEELELRELEKKYSRKVRDTINKSRNSEEVRKILNIENDLTEKSIKEIINENPWDEDNMIDEDIKISMIIDNKDTFETKMISPNNDIVRFIKNRKLVKAVNDETVDKCYNCSIEFSILNRRHHCRSCGRIFCQNCSSRKIDIPNESKIPICDNNINSWLTFSKEVRVCDKCYSEMIEKKTFWNCIRMFQILALEIPLLKRAGTICDTWRKVSIYCLSNLRELQYKLPTYEFNKYEKKILWNNRKYFAGHSQWLIQLMRIINWNNEKQISEAYELINKNRKYNCYQLMCNRLCTKDIKPKDSLILLSKSIKNDNIRIFAVKCLANASIKEIICYLPILIQCLKYESNDCSPLKDLLFNLCISNIDIFNECYWLLSINSFSKKYFRKYNYIKEQLIIDITKKTKVDIRSFLENNMLIDIFENSYLSNNISYTYLKNNLSLLKFPILSIFNPSINIKEFDKSNIHNKNSATSPIVIPYLTDNIYRNLMFKKEDIRKDQIILNIIQLMDIILKHDNINIPIIIYKVIPTSCNSGLIDLVPNSETLFEIFEKGSINNFLHKYNKHKSIDEVSQTYTKSLAFWTVVTHLLGIGDRHMDNIMITHDGILFHIDYGFVLGYESKPLSSNIRVGEKLLEPMGGNDSYHHFKDICSQIFLSLRKHYNLFFTLLLSLSDYDPPISNLKFVPKYLENQIIDRFLPGYSDSESILILNSIIDQHYDSIIQTMNDYIHYYSKDSPLSKTFSSVNTGIANSLTGIVNWFYK